MASFFIAQPPTSVGVLLDIKQVRRNPTESFFDVIFEHPDRLVSNAVFYGNKQGEDTMKKINLFKRHTNSPSYRRMPVSRGFNRGGGIPLFSGMTAVIFALFIATPSFATPTELDKKTVASKAYVDTKQDIIPAGNTGEIVLYNGTSNGQTQFTGRRITETLGSINADNIPTQGAVTAGLDEKENLGNKVAQDLMSHDILPGFWEPAGYDRSFQWLWSTFGLDRGVPTDGGTAFLLPMLAHDYNVEEALDFMNNKDIYPSMNTMLNAMGGMLKLHANPEDISVAIETGYHETEQYLAGIGLIDHHEIQDFASMGRLYLEGNNPVVPFIKDYGGHFVPTLKTMLVALGQMTTNFQPIIRAVSLDTNTNDPITAPVVGYPSVADGQIIPRLVVGFDGNNTYSLKRGDNKIFAWVLGENVFSNVVGTSNLTEAEAKDALPTLGFLRDEILPNFQKILPRKSSDARAMTVTLGEQRGETISTYITAGGSVGLTTRSGAPAVKNYVNGTTNITTFASGTFGYTSAIYQNYIKNALVSLELLKDVYAELNSKITNNALPTGTTGTVVTYNGTNATTGVQEFGERAVYDPANAYNAQNDATKLATMASVKYVCAGYEPAAAGQPAHDGTHPGDEDYCWLWALPN